jgi:hypothetical protein
MMNAIRSREPATSHCGAERHDPLAITDGEVNFLWWFIQGSIMNVETWQRLMRAWGFCERHAWVHLSVEMAFRERYLLSPAILYSGLIQQALRAISPRQLGSRPRVMLGLRPAGSCFLCEMDLAPAARGVSHRQRLDRGRDPSALRAFADELEPLWRERVCAVCSGRERNNLGESRCRSHLFSDLSAGRQVDLAAEHAVLEDLANRVDRLERSFTAQGKPASDADCAAFIAAIGWCSGWRPLLALRQVIDASP